MMSRLWEMLSEAVPVGAGRLHTSHYGAGDFGTLKRYLLDPVVPVLVLMAMAVLTTVMLTMVVAAVADMGLIFESSTAGEVLDPGWCLTQASSPDQGLYVGSTAASDAADEQSSWSDPQTQSQSDSSYAYSTPQ